MFPIAFAISWTAFSYLTCWICHHKLHVRSIHFIDAIAGMGFGVTVGGAIVALITGIPIVTVAAILSTLLIAVILPFSLGCAFYMIFNPWQ